MKIGTTALKYAIKELGKCEIPKGSNWGPDVKKYLNSVGIDFPASWCMAFVHWCHQQAADEFKIENPMFHTGGCMLQWAKRKLDFSVAVPLPGDIFILSFPHGLGHTGIIESVSDANKGWIDTIEGNSNNDGSRNGEAVVRHRRELSKIFGYLRF